MIAIRPETASDVEAIRHVNEQAFGGTSEAVLVDALRDRGAVTLSFVAVQDAHVVAHILFSPVEIVAAEGIVTGIGLGPMSVLPKFQRRGIGAQLIRRGLELLRDAGHPFVIVLGHPQYYPCFGFVPAGAFDIRCPYDVPDEAFMALELRAGALQNTSGTARYQPEFDAA